MRRRKFFSWITSSGVFWVAGAVVMHGRAVDAAVLELPGPKSRFLRTFQVTMGF
jgi:hypothetical protein